MKCFVLSLHRSGTSSASILLENLGVRTIHWPGRDGKIWLTDRVLGRETDLDFVLETIMPVLQRHEAAADVPIPVLYRQLDEHFPDAKWILVLRNPEDWLRSVRKHVGNRELRAFEKIQYWHYFPQQPTYLVDLTDADLLSMYDRHTERVVEFSRKRGADKLGVFNLYDPACGSLIAAFLGYRGEYVMPHIADPLEIKRASKRARIFGTFKRAVQKISGT